MPTQCISPGSSYIATPQFLVLSLHGATAISIPIHLFGYYCILLKTPEQMKSVKWYLLNLHCWIVLYDYTVCILTIPYFLIPTLAGYMVGILSSFGVSYLLQCVLILILLGYVLLAILAIFENRFYTVCTFKWRKQWGSIREVWLGCHYLSVIILVIPFFFLIPEQESAVKQIFEGLPCLPDYILQAPISVAADDITYHMTVYTFLLGFGVSEAFLFICFTVLNTIQQLRERRMSKYLFEVQKKFFIALVIQMLVPLILLLFPLWHGFYVVFFDIYDQSLTNIGVTMESFHGLVSSLVMIFIHKPYREAFFGMFPRGKGSQKQMNQSIRNNHVAPLRIDLNDV